MQIYACFDCVVINHQKGGDCNEHGTIYAILSDFGDRMTMQSMGLMLLLSFGGSQASQRPSGLVWSGIDDIVRGTETPFSWAISRCEDQDQGDRDCVNGRDLIAGK